MHILYFSILINHISFPPFLSNAPHIVKLSFRKLNTVREPSRMKLAKKPVFPHNSSKFMGILLFVLKYLYISLLLEIINVFSRPAKAWLVPLRPGPSHWSIEIFTRPLVKDFPHFLF